MSELNYTVDVNETEASFDPVPADEYTAIIEASDYVDNSKGTGKILKLTYQIIGDGQFSGRKIFENLNLENENKQAVEISRKTLNSIGVATGVTEIKDSSLLHDIPMKINVTAKESKEYGIQNRIKSHKPLADTTTTAKETEEKTNNAPPEPPWGKTK